MRAVAEAEVPERLSRNRCVDGVHDMF